MSPGAIRPVWWRSDEGPTRLNGEAWRRHLASREDERFVGVLRSATFKGHALGSDTFVSKLETALGRRLRPAALGRPRKRTGKRRPKK